MALRKVYFSSAPTTYVREYWLLIGQMQVTWHNPVIWLVHSELLFCQGILSLGLLSETITNWLIRRWWCALSSLCLRCTQQCFHCHPPAAHQFCHCNMLLIVAMYNVWILFSVLYDDDHFLLVSSAVAKWWQLLFSGDQWCVTGPWCHHFCDNVDITTDYTTLVQCLLWNKSQGAKINDWCFLSMHCLDFNQK